MSDLSLIHRGLLATAIAAAAACSSAAMAANNSAGMDEVYAANVSVAVAGAAGNVVVPTQSKLAGDSNVNHTTVIQPLVGAQRMTLVVTWQIAQAKFPNRTTVYPNAGVTFAVQSTAGAPVTDLQASTPSCDFAGVTASCQQTLSFMTPNVTVSDNQVKITPVVPSRQPSNLELQPRHLFVNFSTIEQVAKLDTITTVPSPQCFTYRASQAGLTASLKEAMGGAPVAGRTLSFAFDGQPLGAAATDAAGTATVVTSLANVAAGDHDLYAAFGGDSVYNGSNGSGTVGISYLFVGFQQPINADGSSRFNGGKVLPIKIKLADADGAPVGEAQPKVTVFQYSAATGLGTEMEQPVSVGSANTDNIMRYDPVAGQYVYNWDMSLLANGTYAIVVDLGDSKACGKNQQQVVVTIARKGGK